MMRIVLDAGYHGFCGIEHGPEGREIEFPEKVQEVAMSAVGRVRPDRARQLVAVAPGLAHGPDQLDGA